MERKRQRTKKMPWFLDAIFGEDDPTDDNAGLCGRDKMLDGDNPNVLCVLRESNKKLKETVSKLESVISNQDDAFKKEMNTYQKVIVELQRENIRLHYQVEDLKAAKENQHSPEIDKPIHDSSVHSPSLKQAKQTMKILYDEGHRDLRCFAL
jgi:regulator of replication initiation timing